MWSRHLDFQRDLEGPQVKSGKDSTAPSTPVTRKRPLVSGDKSSHHVCALLLKARRNASSLTTLENYMHVLYKLRLSVLWISVLRNSVPFLTSWKTFKIRGWERLWQEALGLCGAICSASGWWDGHLDCSGTDISHSSWRATKELWYGYKLIIILMD